MFQESWTTGQDDLSHALEAPDDVLFSMAAADAIDLMDQPPHPHMVHADAVSSSAPSAPQKHRSPSFFKRDTPPGTALLNKRLNLADHRGSLCSVASNTSLQSNPFSSCDERSPLRHEATKSFNPFEDRDAATPSPARIDLPALADPPTTSTDPADNDSGAVGVNPFGNSGALSSLANGGASEHAAYDDMVALLASRIASLSFDAPATVPAAIPAGYSSGDALLGRSALEIDRKPKLLHMPSATGALLAENAATAAASGLELPLHALSQTSWQDMFGYVLDAAAAADDVG